MRELLATVAIASMLAAGCPAFANPTGGNVVAGSAAISAAANALTVHQTSNRAIINWQGFSIGTGETTTFLQPSSTAAVLNRVTSSNPSQILGQLKSNGQVYLLNPNGILVGPGGQINTGSFIGSTLDVPNAAFMAGGPLSFTGSAAAGIVNLGTIRAATGDVALLALRVSNPGSILAPNGTAALGAGSSILYAPGGSDAIVVAVPTAALASGGAVDNSGVIAAAQAELKAAGSPYALAVNNGGTISATAVRTIGGRVILDGGGGDAAVSGTITAQAGNDGGSVKVLGANVNVTSAATIRADAAAAPGNGGTVVVKGSDTTTFAGAISARAHALGGNGGSAEVSGSTLRFIGNVDLSAPNGKTGTLLLDPATITVDAPTAAAIVTSLDTADVSEVATSSIAVNSPITNATTIHALTLDAPTIGINANVTLNHGTLILANSSLSAPGSSLTSSAGATITGTVNLSGPFLTTTFNGPLSGNLSIDQASPGVNSFTATNAANAIGGLDLFAHDNSLSGNLAVSSSTAMAVTGQPSAASFNLTAGGNLTMDAGTVLTSTSGGTTLASTGGAFINQAGAGLLTGTGRKIIYSSTDAGGFTDGGLGYTQFNPVSFGSDPVGAGNVTYIALASGLPLLTVTANNTSWVYGSPGTFSASLSAGTPATDFTQPLQFSVLQGGFTNAGTYTIVPFGAISSTYRVSYVNGTLTVTPAPLTITANSASTVYGSLNPTFTSQVSGLVNGDSASSIISGLTLTTSAATFGSGAGNYAIVPNATLASSNYTPQFVNGTFTITPAPLVITANPFSKAYGSANPSFTSQLSGLVNFDTAAGVISGLTFSTSATAGSGVGSYSIVPSGTVSPNYAPQFVNGTLTVTPATLTVTAPNASMVYGNIPALQITALYSGFVNGDTSALISGLQLSTTATAASNVGSYAIAPSGAGAGPNYIVKFVNGTMTIVPAPLYFTVNPASSIGGQPLPPFGASFTGFLNGDGPSVVSSMQFTTDATTASPAGSYTITAQRQTGPAFGFNGGYGLANNYTLIPTPGGTTSTLTMLAPPPQPQLIVTMNGTFDQTAVKQSEVNAFNVATTQIVTSIPPAYDFLNLGGLSNALPEELAVIDAYAATVGLKEADIIAALKDPAQHDTMLGTLLPFALTELGNIINADSSTWTPAQSAFVAGVQEYIHEQKVAAANKASSDYQVWLTEQNIPFATSLDGDGIGGVYLSQITSSTPGIPPPDFINETKVGLILTNQQTVSMQGTQAKLSETATEMLNAQVAAGEIALDYFLNESNEGVLPDNITSALNQLGGFDALHRELDANNPTGASNAYNALTTLLAQANSEWHKGNSRDVRPPTLTTQLIAAQVIADANPPGVTPSASTATLNLGYLPGSVADLGAMAVAASAASGNFVTSSSLVKSFPLLKTFLPKAGIRSGIQAKVDALGAKETDVSKTSDVVAKTDEAVVDAEKTATSALETAGEVLSTVAKFASVVGVVGEVAGNVLQAGIGIAEYTSRAVYQSDFETAMSVAAQPVTVDQLKQMFSGTQTTGPDLLTYLNAMMVTGGSVPSVNK